MNYKNIIVERKGRIEKISLNRTKVLNALNTPLLLEFKAALEKAVIDDMDVIILAGKGRCFCAGLDVREAIDQGYYEYEDSRRETDPTNLIVDIIEMIYNLPQPVIAAINGYAVGGGLEIALACDIVIAAGNAAFLDTHARVGILPGAGLSQRLPRLIGSLRAKEMIFTSKPLTAQDAERFGLVNKIVPLDELDRVTEDTARDILKNNQRIVRQVKSMVMRGALLNMGDAMRLEQQEFLRSRLERKPHDLNVNIPKSSSTKSISSEKVPA